MNLCFSSSGCASRPAKGEPTQVGSESYDGLNNGAGKTSARARVSRGEAAPKTIAFRMPTVLNCLKATTASP